MVQAIVVEEIVEESEVACWVSRRGKVFQEGYLHLCAGELHPSMPGKGGLLLKEECFWGGCGGGFVGVVNRNGYG